MLQFSSSSRWWISGCVWGNGYQPGNAPTDKGWRVAPVTKGSTYCVLIGQRGVQGCASIIKLDRHLDVAVYWDLTPEKVAERCQLTGKAGEADAYHEVVDVPGWGVEVIRLIEAARVLCAEYESE